ncbi:MAG: CD225/dispanin family protein [Acidobacteria bacterium]|nr:CD225/dispanin family protein [Acidobacteriota bacterium]MBV9477227.1 CD225/dispanin family protein [Acidobacteriota bacterium]
MYCTNCGHQRADADLTCTQCGARVRTFPPPPVIPNYLVQSILVTLCCCLPAGIVAIVFSAQVNSKLAAGDVAGAKAASQNAKTWAWVAFGVGVAIALVKVVLVAIAAMHNG